MSFSHLFTPHKIRNLEIRNRIFSSSHQTVLAQDWYPSDKMAAYHEARAAGGAGLIVMEASGTRGKEDSASYFINASQDECIPAFRKVADAVHRHDCKVFGQISGGGRIAGKIEGLMSIPSAPSTIPDHRFHTMPQAMTTGKSVV